VRLLQRNLSADAPETELSVILLLLRFRNVEERRWDIGVGDGHGGGTERPPEMVLEYSSWRFHSRKSTVQTMFYTGDVIGALKCISTDTWRRRSIKCRRTDVSTMDIRALLSWTSIIINAGCRNG